MNLHVTNEDHDGAFHMFAYRVEGSPVLLGVTYCNEALEEVVLQYVQPINGEDGVMEELKLEITASNVSQVLVERGSAAFTYHGDWAGEVNQLMFACEETQFTKAIIDFVKRLRHVPISINDPLHQHVASALMSVFKIKTLDEIKSEVDAIIEEVNTGFELGGIHLAVSRSISTIAGQNNMRGWPTITLMCTLPYVGAINYDDGRISLENAVANYSWMLEESGKNLMYRVLENVYKVFEEKYTGSFSCTYQRAAGQPKENYTVTAGVQLLFSAAKR